MDNLLYYKSQNAHIRAYENEIKQQELNTQYQIAQNKIIREGERNLLTSAQIMQQLSDLYNDLIASKKEIGKIIPFDATEKSALPADQSVKDTKADSLTQRKLTFEKKIKNKNASKIKEFIKSKKSMSDIDTLSSQADTASTSLGSPSGLSSLSSMTIGERNKASKKVLNDLKSKNIPNPFGNKTTLTNNELAEAYDLLK